MENEQVGVSSYVVVIEGLATSLIGVYGSNIGRTPTWDKLASRGVTLDQCFVDSLDLMEQLESLWTGQHALCSSVLRQEAPGLWGELESNQIPGRVITDCERVAEYAERRGCRDVTYVPPSAAGEAASSVDECVALQLFFAAAEALRERDDASPELTWIHSSGMRLPWDVPIEIRNTFVDPDDPEPPQSVGPPCFRIDETTDPDLVVGWGQVAAAQATIFDEGLAVLLAATENESCGTQQSQLEDAWSAKAAEATDAEGEEASGPEQSHEPKELSAAFSAGPLLNPADSLVLIGLGGLALGEHGFVGQLSTSNGDGSAVEEAERMHGELLSCAALLISGGNWGGHSDGHVFSPAVRRPEILQLADLGSTVRSMVGIESEAECWGKNIFGLGFPDSPIRWDQSVQLALVEDATVIWGRSPAWSLLISREEWEHHRGQAFALDEEGLLAAGEFATDSVVASGHERADFDFTLRLYVKPEDRWEVSDVADRRSDIAEELILSLLLYRKAIVRGERSALLPLSEGLLSLMR